MYLPEPFGLAFVDECKFCLGILKKVCDRLDLAVRVHRDDNGAAIDGPEICDGPFGVVLADQRNAVAKADTFLLEPVRDRADLPERFAKCVCRIIRADDAHCHALLARFE